MSNIEDLLKNKKKRASQKVVGESIIKIKADNTLETNQIKNMIEKYDKSESIKRKFLKNLIKIDKEDFFRKERLINKVIFESKLKLLKIDTLEEDDKFKDLVRIVYEYNGDSKKARSAIIYINDRLNRLDYVDTSANLELIEIIKNRPNLFKKIDNIQKIYEKEFKKHENLSRQFLNEYERKRVELIEGTLKDVYKKLKSEMDTIPLTQEEKDNLKINELKRLEILNYITSFETDEDDYLFGDNELYDFIIENLKTLDESKDENNKLFSGILKIIPITENKIEATEMYVKFCLKVLEKYKKERDTIISCLYVLSEDVILLKRYNVVRVDIFIENGKEKEIRKTLKDLYGPLEDLISFKNIEKITNRDGFKFVEKQVYKEEKDKSKIFKKLSDDIEIEGLIYRPLKDVEQKVKDVEQKVKDVEQKVKGVSSFIKTKTKEEIQNEQIELYDKLENYFPFYNKNTLLAQLRDEDETILRNYIRKSLINFFDEKSVISLEKNIYNNNKYSVLLSYLEQIGNIVLFVDDKYMKNFAKLFNDRLSNGYFDADKLSNITINEILYDIYNNSSNDENALKKLDELIKRQSKLFQINTLQKLAIEHANIVSFKDKLNAYMLYKDDINSKTLDVNPYIIKIRNQIRLIKDPKLKNNLISSSFDDMSPTLKMYYNNKAENDIKIYQREQLYTKQKPFNFEDKTGIYKSLLEEIEPLNIHSCNVDFRGFEQYKNYIKIKKEYQDKKNKNSDENDILKSFTELENAKRELAPFLKDIIYYKDEEDAIYCFNLLDLIDQIKENDLINHYNNKNFTDEFVDYIKKYKKQVKDVPIQKTELLNIVYEDLNKLDMNLKNNKNITKDQICNYYTTYIFPKSELEIKLNKPEEEIKKMDDYCKGILITNIPKKKANKKDTSKSVENFSFKPINIELSHKTKIKNIEMLLKDRSTSSDASKEHSTPSDASKEHSTPSDDLKEHSTPSDASKQHSTPSDASKQHSTPNEVSKELQPSKNLKTTKLK